MWLYLVVLSKVRNKFFKSINVHKEGPFLWKTIEWSQTLIAFSTTLSSAKRSLLVMSLTLKSGREYKTRWQDLQVRKFLAHLPH